jgi:selenide,water dikinase
VFAAGDVAALDGQPRPKSGVYAVREGPYLTTNLRRVLQGRSLRRYRAQRRVLALISEGRRSAVLSRGALYARGAMLWRLKDFIDRRFVTRFLSGNAKSAPHDTANTVDLATAMRCGGCGSKLAADLLTRVLRRLDVPVRAELISGIGDDAAVLLTPGRITATVDGFRAMIEDPYRLGRIAAHHALSDVFAMGGRPTAALALVSVPFMADALMEDELYQVMFGACEVLRSEGVALAGGHSSEGTELSVAFAVLGDVPAAPWRKDQLRAGDVLVVTKAIGTGVVLAGAMRGMARSRDVQATIAAMDRSNAPAAAVLAKFDVRAVTDVTGFGLLGHLSEMLRASGLAADIEASAVPVLPGARCLLEQGVESSLAPGNALALSDFEIVSGSPAAASVRLLIDPQTAGGLLAGVAAERADALLAALSQVGCEAAAIGVVRDDVAAGCGRIRVDRGH